MVIGPVHALRGRDSEDQALTYVQNSRALRRIATDHAALHVDLPPYYLFPQSGTSDDLTQLDILLAGPTHTPFAAGLWKLHLNIPPAYPQQAPTAHFRTPIFHPNVDPQSGAVCVETLKRDWHSSYTLAHILQTISCLLIQPNPDSALNAEAGALIQESYDAFARRAELMTSISAAVPRALQQAVQEAQTRGRQDEPAIEIPARRRRTIAQARARAAGRSPPPAPSQTSQPPAQPWPFVFQAGSDDVFGHRTLQGQCDEDAVAKTVGDDGEMTEADQENDQFLSPQKSSSLAAAITPRRPHGTPVPLGELFIDEDTSEDMEPEYPPSPRKSPSKSSPRRRQNNLLNVQERPESSADGASRARNITPMNVVDRPLAEDSPFISQFSPSPRKGRANIFETPGASAQQVSRNLFGRMTMADDGDSSIFGRLQAAAPSSPPPSRQVNGKRTAQDAKLWELCDGDIKRWNRADFDQLPFEKKAPRW